MLTSVKCRSESERLPFVNFSPPRCVTKPCRLFGLTRPPATLSNGVLTLPVAGGRVNPTNLRGFVTHRGGLKFTKGNRSLSLRHFTLVSTKRGVFLYATTPVRRCRTAGHRSRGRGPVRICFVRGEVVRLARLSNIVRNGKSITATLLLSQQVANFINRVAGSHVVSAGANLGTEQTTVTTA